MKKAFLFSAILLIVALACDLSVSVAPSTNTAPVPDNTMVPASETSTQIPASATPIQATAGSSATPVVQPSPVGDTAVTFEPLSLVIPSGVASGASGKDYPRVDGEDAAYWEKTPGHLQISLGDYYVLQGRFHQPQIYVYPALGYAELVPGAFESMHRLRNVMYDPSAPISAEQLPTVPFFNAAQLFASNIQLISFQNGSGVRFLTEYAQYPASINNYDLFYHFQGFTNDGEFYIVAIFPITVPVLAETSDGGAVLPPGGIPYPDTTDPEADLQGYYTAVTALLNGTSPQAFAPTIDQLDLLIQSMQIMP